MAMRALLAGGRVKDPWLPAFEKLHILELKEQEAKGEIPEGSAKEYEENKAFSLDLRILSASESEQFTNLQAQDYNPLTGSRCLKKWGSAIQFAALKSITGWHNMLDKANNEKKFIGLEDKDDRIIGATLEDIASIPREVMQELYHKVDELRTVPDAVFI